MHVCVSVFCLSGIHLSQNCLIDLAEILHKDRGLSLTMHLISWWLITPWVLPQEPKMLSFLGRQCFSLPAIISYFFPRWQHSCINTVREILCQSCFSLFCFIISTNEEVMRSMWFICHSVGLLAGVLQKQSVDFIET